MQQNPGYRVYSSYNVLAEVCSLVQLQVLTQWNSWQQDRLPLRILTVGRTSTLHDFSSTFYVSSEMGKACHFIPASDAACLAVDTLDPQCKQGLFASTEKVCIPPAFLSVWSGSPFLNLSFSDNCWTKKLPALLCLCWNTSYLIIRCPFGIMAFWYFGLYGMMSFLDLGMKKHCFSYPWEKSIFLVSSNVGWKVDLECRPTMLTSILM